MTDFTITVEIPVAQSVVWSVMVDVERWPEWTDSISRVKRISPGALRVGSRVRIHQPNFPPAFWRVTELKPGVEFAWVSRAPGLRVTARHKAEAAGRDSRVTLSIHYEGWLGTWLAQWTRHLNERYLEMEANGLKARCREFETRTLL